MATSVCYWLMKAEPDSRVVKNKDVKFSVDDFESIKITPWEGVRNHSAKLHMKSMKIGDKVLFYHSNTKSPGIAALAEVHKEAYPDHTAWDPTHPYHDPKSDEAKPTWFMVDLEFKSRLPYFVPLSLLRHLEASEVGDLVDETSDDSQVRGLSYLSDEDLASIKAMPLLTQGRLSVQPVTDVAFAAIEKLGEKGGWENLQLGKPKPKLKAKPQPKAEVTSKPKAKRPRKHKGKKAKDEDADSEGDEPPAKRPKLEGVVEEGPLPSRRSTRTKPAGSSGQGSVGVLDSAETP